jgi:hypothetical protein
MGTHFPESSCFFPGYPVDGLCKPCKIEALLLARAEIPRGYLLPGLELHWTGGVKQAALVEDCRRFPHFRRHLLLLLYILSFLIQERTAIIREPEYAFLRGY